MTSRIQQSPAYWPSQYSEQVLQCDWQVFTHATSRVQCPPVYWLPEYSEWFLQHDWQHVTNIIFSYVWHALACSESFSDAKLEQLCWSCFSLRCSAWAAEQIFSDQALSLSNCTDFVFCSDAQPEQLNAWCHLLWCSTWAVEATCVSLSRNKELSHIFLYLALHQSIYSFNTLFCWKM